MADASGSGEESCPLCGVVLPIGVLPYHVDECIGANDDVVVVSLYLICTKFFALGIVQRDLQTSG